MNKEQHSDVTGPEIASPLSYVFVPAGPENGPEADRINLWIPQEQTQGLGVVGDYKSTSTQPPLSLCHNNPLLSTALHS